MSEVTRLRATLQLDNRLKSGLAGAKSDLTSWVRSSKGWSKPISDEARKVGNEITDEMRKALRDRANKLAYEAGKQIGESLRRGAERAGTALTIGLTLPLIALGKAAISASSDLAESTSKMEVTFGASKRAVVEFGETSAKSFGIAKRQAYEYASTFGGILRETKLSADATALMSVQLTKLGADLASLHNIKNMEDALLKLRSALTGEYEPLKNLGYTLNEHVVQLKAVELGYKGKTSALTESQKMLARYMIILEKTKKDQGDFTRTIEGAANQTRILQAELMEATAEFGDELLPLWKDALKVGRDLTGMLKSLSTEQRQQILKYGLMAAALGPLIRLVLAFGSAISGIIKLRTAYVAAQAAMALANATTGTSAATAAGQLVGLRGALASIGSGSILLGLTRVSAVLAGIVGYAKLISYANANTDYKKLAERYDGFSFKSQYEKNQEWGARGSGTGPWLKSFGGLKLGGQDDALGGFINAAKGSGYQGFIGPLRDQVRTAKTKAAPVDEMKALQEAIANAFKGGAPSGGGGGKDHAAKVKEIAKEYDYWGRVMQKVAQDGFAPFRVSMDQLAASSAGAESPLARVVEAVRGMIEQGDLKSARSTVTDYVDQLKAEPKEIEGIVSSIISALGDGNEEFKAKVSAAIGDARNLSGTAKAVAIDVARMKDAANAAAKAEKEREETRGEFRGQLRSLNDEYRRLNASETQNSKIMELQSSELWPKLTMWERLSLMILAARNDALAKQKEHDRERLARAQQLGAIFAAEAAQYRERIVLFGNETEMAKLQYRLREGDLKNISAIGKAYLLYAQGIIDAKTAAADLIAKWKEWVKVRNDEGKSRYNEYIKSLTERLLELKGAYDQLLRVQLAREITTVDPKEKQRQIDEIIGLKKQVEGAEEFYKYLDQFASGAADLFVNLFRDIGKGFDEMFKNLMTGFRNLLNEIAMEILKSQLKNFLVKVLSKAFGGDWGEPKAMGGPVSAGRPYLVGERGPELFVPSGHGAIVPTNQLAAAAGGGGGVSVIVNMTVNATDADSFRKSESHIAAKLGIATKRAVERDYGRTRR